VTKYLKYQFNLTKYNYRSFSNLISNNKSLLNQKSDRFYKINYLAIRNLTSKMTKYNYPKVRRDETITENFHGKNVSFY
jgi:hypothetical protein